MWLFPGMEDLRNFLRERQKLKDNLIHSEGNYRKENDMNRVRIYRFAEFTHNYGKTEKLLKNISDELSV